MHDLASAMLVVLAGASGGAPAYALRALAVALEWTTPRLAGTSGFRVAHEKGAWRGMVKVFGMTRGRDSLVLRARALV